MPGQGENNAAPFGYEVGGEHCFPPRTLLKKDFFIHESGVQTGRRILNSR